MRIAVVSTTVFPVGIHGDNSVTGTVGYSGLEELAWQTSKGLAAKGHQVTLIAPAGSSCPGCQVVHTGPPGQHSEEQAWSGWRNTGNGTSFPGYWQHLLQQDVVIDESWMKSSYLLKAEGRLLAPVLGVCHAPVNTMMTKLPPNVDKPCFVCISQDQANHFEALFSHPARVCHNGCDVDYYRPLGTPRSDRFLFLARMSSIKGPDIGIDVALETGSNLDIIGDTQITQEPQLLEECKRKADGKQIKLVGNCNRGECVWWHSQSRALWHPNLRFKEPFGLSPVESQLCGSPVLAWRKGAMIETVAHGETGFLINSVEEMVDVVKSGALDGLDRNRCREWASQFSIQRMVNRYESLCVEAVETGGW